MAETFTVTGQTYGYERQPDGTTMPVVTIAFTSKTEPPVAGSISVPQSLLKDKAKYAETVQAAIEQAVGAHSAVNNL